MSCLTGLATDVLKDSRTGDNIQHSKAALFRQAVCSRVVGYEDTNDAHRLAVDPVMRSVVGSRETDKTVAISSALSRFETKMLTELENLPALAKLNRQWITRAMKHTTAGVSSWTWTVRRARYTANEYSWSGHFVLYLGNGCHRSAW